MQRRWISGTIFAVGFLGGFFWLMVLALGIIIDFYRLGFEFDSFEPEPKNAMAMLPPLVMAMVFYLISLFDVLIAQQRMRHTHQQKNMDLFSTEDSEIQRETSR